MVEGLHGKALEVWRIARLSFMLKAGVMLRRAAGLGRICVSTPKSEMCMKAVNAGRQHEQ